METGINQTSRSCCYQLRRFRCVPKCLSTEATVTLVTSLILSRLDYCNSPFSSACFLCPYNYSLRCSQNCAETEVKLTISLLCSNLSAGSQSRREFSTTWLLSVITVSWLCTSPSYVCDCLQSYTPFLRTLRSAFDTLCVCGCLCVIRCCNLWIECVFVCVCGYLFDICCKLCRVCVLVCVCACVLSVVVTGV